jgi:hypothetical protein
VLEGGKCSECCQCGYEESADVKIHSIIAILYWVRSRAGRDLYLQWMRDVSKKLHLQYIKLSGLQTLMCDIA